MKTIPAPKFRTTVLAIVGLGLIFNPVFSANTISNWNGAGVTGGTGLFLWDVGTNYSTTPTFSSTNDLNFSTITSPGSSLTLSANSAGTVDVGNLSFGTAGSTLASVEFLNFNGNGTPGGTTLNLASGIALPKFTGSVVVLGSDLTLNLSNAAHSVSATTGTAVLIVNSLVTGGGAAASFTNASTSAPMILTNNNNSFTNGGLSGSRYNGYVGFTSVGNVGSGNSSLGNASTSANGVLWMSNSSALDYIGVGNQSTDRTVRLDGTVSFNNSATGTTVTYNGTFTPNGVAGAEVRVGAITGSTVVIDSVISGNLGLRRQTGTTYSPTTGVASVTDGLGTLVLGGANTHSGANLLNIGTTKITNASALGFGGLQTTSTGNTQIAAGAVLDLNGQSNVNEPILLAGGSLLNNSGTPASIGTGIAASTVASATGSGSGYSSGTTVAISGTGTGATANVSLGVTAASFTLSFGDRNYTVAPTVTITGGTGANGAGPAATATAILSGGTTGTVIGITITNAGTGFTSAPTIAFSGGTSTGTTTTTGIGNANNYTISGLSMTAAGTGYTGTPTYTFTGGSGSGATATAALSSVTLTANTNSIGGSGDLTINAVVSQTGSPRAITKVGAGILTLSGANTYTGTTTINEGTLSINSISTISAPAESALGAPTTSANGTIAIGTGATSATLVYTGSAQTTDRIISLAGATGGAALDQSGTGLLKFTSNIAAAGVAATDQRKTLTLQGSTSGSGELSGIIADSTAGTTGQKTTGVTKTGTGMWTLSGANTYTGTTTINGGILNAGAANIGSTSGAFGKTGNITFTGGTLQYSAVSASSDYSSRIKSSTSSISIDTNAQSVTFATALDSSNTGGFTKSGAGTLILSALNTYTGATTVNAGTLTFGNSYTLNGANQITVAATGAAGTDYATVSSTGGTLTFGGTLGINITTSLVGGESFDLFTANGGALAGDFGLTTGNVSVTGSYIASLTNNGSGIWTGTTNGLDFTFSTSGVNAGILLVTAVPEPATYAALFGALALLGTVIHRRRSQKR